MKSAWDENWPLTGKHDIHTTHFTCCLAILFQFKCQRQPLRKIAIGKVQMGFCTSWLLGSCLSYPACIHCCVATFLDWSSINHLDWSSIRRHFALCLSVVLCPLTVSMLTPVGSFPHQACIVLLCGCLKLCNLLTSLPSSVGCVYVGWSLQPKAMFFVSYVCLFINSSYWAICNSHNLTKIILPNLNSKDWNHQSIETYVSETIKRGA